MSDQARRKNVYLVVADETQEFNHALRYAARAVKANNAKMGILYVMPELDFVHWGHVENRMRQEQRQDAEAFLAQISERIASVENLCPCFFLEEGAKAEAVSRVLKDNDEITKLILGAHSDTNNPGELVSYFAGKGVSELHAPLTIVPDHLTNEQIDNLL